MGRGRPRCETVSAAEVASLAGKLDKAKKGMSLRAIAQAAGLSPTTVSLALRGKIAMSRETYEKLEVITRNQVAAG